MTRSEQVFLLILILNTMVAIGYLICCMVRNGWKAPRRKEYWIKTIVMIICPLVGPAFFFAVWFVYYLLFHQNVDLEDVVFSKERVETHLKADEEQEGNMVPIEEALVVCDKDNLRTLVMNVGAFYVSLLLKRRHITVGTQDSVLDQIADNRQHVCLPERHALPRNAPHHQNQLHLIL